MGDTFHLGLNLREGKEKEWEDWGARGYIILYKGYSSIHYGIIYICSIFLVPTKFYYVTIIQHKHTKDVSNTLLLA